MKKLLITLVIVFNFEFEGQSQTSVAAHFNLKNPSGKELSLEDFKGKIIYLDFWASWCGPCIKSMPKIKQLYEKYGAHPQFEIVGISIDFERKDWEKALNRLNLPWVNLHVTKDLYAEIRKAYRLETIPKTYLIDKSGKIIGESLSLARVEEVLKKNLTK